MEKESLSILIIDPQIEDHALIQDSFDKSDAPTSLRFVTSSEEALSALKNSAFDIVLTDHSLPQANAFHFLFEIRQRGLALPVLLLTRNAEARVAREAFHRGADDFLFKEDLELISLFEVIGNLLEKRKRRDEAELRLREQVEKDALTGLYNRRYFGEVLEREFKRARRYRRDLSLAMIDLDGFKAINDACGHPQGDQVLRQVGRLLVQGARFVDIVVRYGGDEFAIVFPETDLKTASRIADRLLQELRNSPFLYEGRVFPLSASFGVANLRLGHDSPQALLKEADKALYQAKRGSISSSPASRGTALATARKGS